MSDYLEDCKALFSELVADKDCFRCYDLPWGRIRFGYYPTDDNYENYNCVIKFDKVDLSTCENIITMYAVSNNDVFRIDHYIKNFDVELITDHFNKFIAELT